MEVGHWSFPAFGLELKHLLFLGLEPAGFQTGTDTVNSSAPQASVFKLELPCGLSWVSPIADCTSGDF